jgi:hypothetical protein
MIIPILILTMVATSAGAAHAGPGLAQTHQAAFLGSDSANQADSDYDDEEAGELREWHESRVWYVRGGVSRWTAIFGDNYGLGYGLHGGYAYGWKPNLVIRATVGTYYFKAEDIAGARPTATSTLWVIPILVGTDYLIKPEGTMRPFIGAGLGAYYLKANFDDADTSKFEFSNLFQAYFGGQARAGLSIVRPNSNFGYEIAGSYNMIFNDLSEFNMGTPSHHDHWEIGAGITYFVPEF